MLNTSTAVPGDYLWFDYRSSAVKQAAESNRLPQLNAASLKLVQWNIERGYKIDKIIEELQRVDADVITLQELDIACERTHWADIAKAICEALQCCGVFALEFVEHDSHDRSHENRCGRQETYGPAFHGNAILSKQHTLQRPRVVPHSWLLNWNVIGHKLKEPRTGFRSFLCCEVEDDRHLLMVYSLHLEVFHCGPLGRVRQVGDVLYDVGKRKERFNQLNEKQRKNFHIFIGGDFNTIGHSIVRLSGKYHRDRMWLLSLGENEATWFQRKFLCKLCPSETTLLQRLATNSHWLWRFVYGFSKCEMERIFGGASGSHYLYDPFNKYSDVTLNNPAYRGFVQGKLDWMLLSNVRVNHASMFNHDYSASDHRGLFAEVSLFESSEPADVYVPWQRHWFGEVLPYLVVRLTAIATLGYLCSSLLSVAAFWVQ